MLPSLLPPSLLFSFGHNDGAQYVNTLITNDKPLSVGIRESDAAAVVQHLLPGIRECQRQCQVANRELWQCTRAADSMVCELVRWIELHSRLPLDRIGLLLKTQ